MSSIELQAVMGKRAERERHLFCRILLLEHITHDSRFIAVAFRAVQKAGFYRLHAAAAKELAAGGPVNGEAVTRYMAAWENDLAVSAAVEAFVRDELHLSWPWLAPDLTRWYFLAMKNSLPRVEKESIPFHPWNVKGESGRYQEPVADTMRLHVSWFYRHRVKNPPEKLDEIAGVPRAETHGASEAARRARDAAIGRKETVRSGIKNAARMLDAVVPPGEWARHTPRIL